VKQLLAKLGCLPKPGPTSSSFLLKSGIPLTGPAVSFFAGLKVSICTALHGCGVLLKNPAPARHEAHLFPLPDAVAGYILLGPRSFKPHQTVQLQKPALTMKVMRHMTNG
jgi:hypothetical protein